MSRQHHSLKTETEFYQAIVRGDKHFECRINDRGFEVYDMVTLEESVNGTLTGRNITGLEICYILKGPAFGIADGHCVFCWHQSHKITIE